MVSIKIRGASDLLPALLSYKSDFEMRDLGPFAQFPKPISYPSDIGSKPGLSYDHPLPKPCCGSAPRGSATPIFIVALHKLLAEDPSSQKSTNEISRN